MTRRQNSHYNISSKKNLKTDDEYVSNSAQIKLELDVKKVTKEGESFQSLSEKQSQVISECQFQLKSRVIEAGNLNKLEKISLPSYPSWNRSTTFQKYFGHTTI